MDQIYPGNCLFWLEFYDFPLSGWWYHSTRQEFISITWSRRRPMRCKSETRSKDIDLRELLNELWNTSSLFRHVSHTIHSIIAFRNDRSKVVLLGN